MRRAFSQRHAFTLVELLVVIAIISLLIAILLPVVNKARVLSNRVKCSSNQRQLAAAVLMYSNDFGGMLPFCNCIRLETIRQIEKGYGYDGWLYQFYGSHHVTEDIEKGGLWKYLRTHEVYRCPADEEPFNGTNVLSSYRMNHTADLDIFLYHPKMTRFRPDAFLFWEFDGSSSMPVIFGQQGGDAHPSNGITIRHGGVAPVACFDSHVETLSAAEFAREAVPNPGRLRAPPAVTWD